MSKQSIQRRDFLKRLGLGSAVLGVNMAVPGLISKTKSGILVQSEPEYGGFVVEKLERDKTYRYDKKVLKQMSEKSTVFGRNIWDPDRQNRPDLKEDLRYERVVTGGGKIPNQTRLDFALYDGAWALSYMGGGLVYEWGIEKKAPYNLGPWKPGAVNMSWPDATNAVKHSALFYGASLTGVAELNPLWVYSDYIAMEGENRGDCIPVLRDGDRFEQSEKAWYIPESMNRVVSLAFEEDYLAIINSPGRLASAAVGNGYSRMAFTSYCLAEFIRSLGYRAIPAGNGVGLSVPMALDAGLGELGRNGLLITPKYGPRVRLAKVITDMPLIPDAPISFGVTEFCENCLLCADYCPSEAITKGKQTWSGRSAANNPGSFKWYVESEKCFDFNGFSCSNCKRVCPFTKPNDSWLHQMTRKIIAGKVGLVDRVLVTLDQSSGYGREIQAADFWKMDGKKSITARDRM